MYQPNKSIQKDTKISIKITAVKAIKMLEIQWIERKQN